MSKLCFNNRFVNNLSLSRTARERRERRGKGHFRRNNRIGARREITCVVRLFEIGERVQISLSLHILRSEIWVLQVDYDNFYLR